MAALASRLVGSCVPKKNCSCVCMLPSENEAKRASKHANKKIIYLPPFWNEVYGCTFIISLSQFA